MKAAILEDNDWAADALATIVQCGAFPRSHHRYRLPAVVHPIPQERCRPCMAPQRQRSHKMNAFFLVCLVACIAAGVASVWAHRNDNLAALEALDDEALAAEASDAWNRGDWA